ncbi:MAG: DUF2490 domain-containing protein [Eudoraea sp.]|uniref:DUF2490 domain-containing protein n=1 Tax=Eudoraea sp. TaxID=1979955 RepID=UPI00326585AB
MNKIYICIALLFILAHQEEAFGQEIDNQFWLNYTLKVKTPTNFTYGGDVGVRGVWSNSDWNQILIRPSVNYKFNKTYSVALATAIFYSDNIYAPNITEFRIHQDFNVEWLQTKWFSMFSRLRIEQRFFSYQQDSLPNEFRLRGRLLLGVQSQDLKWFGPKRPIYFQILYEGFQTIGSDNTEFLINQGRFHIAFGHRIAKNWKYELHFIQQSSRLYETSGLKASQQIFRLRLFHTINLKKSKPPNLENEEDRVDDFN